LFGIGLIHDSKHGLATLSKVTSGGGAAGGEARLEHRERLGGEIVGGCLKPAVQNVGLSIDGECKTHHLLRSVPLHYRCSTSN
jgi:hypothetical protein